MLAHGEETQRTCLALGLDVELFDEQFLLLIERDQRLASTVGGLGGESLHAARGVVAPPAQHRGGRCADRGTRLAKAHPAVFADPHRPQNLLPLLRDACPDQFTVCAVVHNITS